MTLLVAAQSLQLIKLVGVSWINVHPREAHHIAEFIIVLPLPFIDPRESGVLGDLAFAYRSRSWMIKTHAGHGRASSGSLRPLTRQRSACVLLMVSMPIVGQDCIQRRRFHRRSSS